MALDILDGAAAAKTLKSTLDGSDHVVHHNIDTVIPGTGATNLGKAEDAAHSSGDVGVMLLAVRKDTATQLAGTDADYSPLINDASGRLHARVGVIDAGETHIGEIGGSTALIAVTPTLDTSAVAAGDVISSTATITGAMRVNAGTGVLQSIVINGKDDVGLGFNIVLFQNTQSLGTVNGAPTISDANADDIIGIIPVYASDFVDLGGTRVATIGADRCKGLVLKSGASSTDLFFSIFAIDAGTYTASGLVFKFGILRD